MKTKLTIIFGLVLLLPLIVLAGCGDNQNTNTDDSTNQAENQEENNEDTNLLAENVADGKPYEIETGYIKYQTNYDGYTDYNEHYWKDWGNVMANYMYSPDGDYVTISDMNEGVIYSYDPTTKTGTVTHSEDLKTYFQDDDTQAFLQDLENTAEQEADMNFDYVKTGQEEFLGVNCEVYEVTEYDGATFKVWVYKGLLLKSETIVGTDDYEVETSEEAIEFQPDTAVDPSKFEVPSDVTLEDLGDLDDQMKELDAALEELESLGEVDSLEDLETLSNAFDDWQ